MQTKLLKLGLFASIVSIIADIFLLYYPSARYYFFDYRFLTEIPLWRLYWGHYLGVLAIPFELAGLWAVLIQVRSEAWRIASFIFLSWLMSCGAIYHSGMLWLGDWLRLNPEQNIEQVRIFFEPMGWVQVAGFALISVLLSIACWRGEVDLPRKILWFNPILVYLIIGILYIVYTPLGKPLLIAGLNISLAIFFTAALYLLPRKPIGA